MRWNVDPIPKVGDTRTVKLFAWVPIRLDNDTKVWLETYHEDQKYTRGRASDFWMPTRRYS